MRIILFVLMVSMGIASGDGLVVGGYATYQEMLKNSPTLLDTSMYLLEAKRVECQRAKVYTLRFISPNGNERSWVSEKRLWGYSDGTTPYIFEKGFFSPLQAWDSTSAWFYALATRSSSGPQGVVYLERPFLYDATKNRSNEVTYSMIQELFSPFPELVKLYEETPRKKRDLPTFLHAYFAVKAPLLVEPTPQSVVPTLQATVPPSQGEVPVVEDNDSLPAL